MNDKVEVRRNRLTALAAPTSAYEFKNQMLKLLGNLDGVTGQNIPDDWEDESKRGGQFIAVAFSKPGAAEKAAGCLNWLNSDHQLPTVEIQTGEPGAPSSIVFFGTDASVTVADYRRLLFDKPLDAFERFIQTQPETGLRTK